MASTATTRRAGFCPWLGELALLGVWPFVRVERVLVLRRSCEADIGKSFAALALFALASIVMGRGLVLLIGLLVGGPTALVMAIPFALADAVVLFVFTSAFACVCALGISVTSRALQNQLSWRESLRFVLLGAGSLLWVIVPFVGVPLALVCWIIIIARVMAANVSHSEQRGRIMTASLIVPVVLVVALMINEVRSGMYLAQFSVISRLVPDGNSYYQTDLLRDRLSRYTTMPRHAIELARPANHFPTLAFVPGAERGDPAQVQLGEHTLAEFLAAVPEKQERMIDDIVASRDWTVRTGYTFGAFVFLCPGMTIPTGGDPHGSVRAPRAARFTSARGGADCCRSMQVTGPSACASRTNFVNGSDSIRCRTTFPFRCGSTHSTTIDVRRR